MPRRVAARRLWCVVPLLLLSACGSAEPAALKPLPQTVPADLCATVPEALRTGLVSDTTTDDTGNPTAACSLRSPVGAAEPVRAVITWLQVDDEYHADDVLASQCRSFDLATLRNESGFRATGADKACAASGRSARGGSATMAAVAGQQVVTVRYDAEATDAATALSRGRTMLEGVLAALTTGP